MKLALATWNGRISPVFDVTRQVLLLEIEDGRVTARHEEMLPGTEMQAQVKRLAELAPEILICGAISKTLAALLERENIQVVPFTAGAVEEVLTAWLAGTLPDAVWSMPGCGGHMRRCHGQRAGGRGRAGWSPAQPSASPHETKRNEQ